MTDGNANESKQCTIVSSFGGLDGLGQFHERTWKLSCGHVTKDEHAMFCSQCGLPIKR